MARILEVELLMEDDDGEHYFLTADDVESVTIEGVVGDLIHTSKMRLTVTLSEGAVITKETIPEGDEEEDDDE